MAFLKDFVVGSVAAGGMRERKKMKNLLLIVGALLLILPFPAQAETIQVGAGIILHLSLPDKNWVLSQQAPPFLVAQTRAQIKSDLLAQGQDASTERVRKIAQQRLGANEAYVFNPASKAVLTIDFSRERPGEEPPGAEDIAASSRYALGSLQSEKGVRLISKNAGETEVRGARFAYRIEAHFTRDGKAKKFLGIVGYLRPCWFYLYYTDPLEDSRDYGDMTRILRSISLTESGKP